MGKQMHPYDGNEKFIFISYSHRDTELVLNIIQALSQQGYRIWFDEGIKPGSSWDDNIANHIQSCHCFLAFISQNYIQSENCKDELNYARDLDKDRLLVYLEDLTLPAGMAMRLNRLQAIFLSQYPQLDAFIRKLEEAPFIDPCKETPKPIATHTPEAPATTELVSPPETPATTELVPPITPAPETLVEKKPEAPADAPKMTGTDFGREEAFALTNNNWKTTLLKIPSGYTRILPWAFKGMRITKIVIPNTVTELCDYALAGIEGLQEVSIPNSVRNIGKDVLFMHGYAQGVVCKPGSRIHQYCKSQYIRTNLENPTVPILQEPSTLADKLLVKMASLNREGCLITAGSSDSAVQKLTVLALAGNYYAMSELAYAYFYGIGTDKDYEQALTWALPAAYAGINEARQTLAKAYENGFGVPTSPFTAAIWYASCKNKSRMEYLADILKISSHELYLSAEKVFKF